MTTTPRSLITLVAESGLENRLVAMLLDQGARGYTVSGAHGQGPRGERAGDISGGNIRIETVVSEEVAKLIIARLERDYFPHYAVTCWLSDVQVIREERY